MSDYLASALSALSLPERAALRAHIRPTLLLPDGELFKINHITKLITAYTTYTTRPPSPTNDSDSVSDNNTLLTKLKLWGGCIEAAILCDWFQINVGIYTLAEDASGIQRVSFLVNNEDNNAIHHKIVLINGGRDFVNAYDK